MDHHLGVGASGYCKKAMKTNITMAAGPMVFTFHVTETCLAIKEITCVVLVTRVVPADQGWSRDIAEFNIGAGLKMH